MAEPAAGRHHVDTMEFASRSWTADGRQLAPIRTQVRGWSAPLVLPGDAEDDIVLVVSEAATNCVEHAYRREHPAAPSSSPSGPKPRISALKSSTTAHGDPRQTTQPIADAESR